MPTLLRVDTSVRVNGSISRAVTDTAASAWQAAHPGGEVIRRDLSAAPLPSDAWALSLASRYLPAEQWTPEHRQATELVTTLADELIASDGLILAAPLYNFGVSQYAKVWIDLLISDSRLGPGSSVLTDKPALIVIAQGGGYREGAPRYGWDHATSYLQRILGDNFGMAVDTVIADLTLAGSTPAMAHLVDAAQQSLQAAHATAAGHGRDLTDREAGAAAA